MVANGDRDSLEISAYPSHPSHPMEVSGTGFELQRPSRSRPPDRSALYSVLALRPGCLLSDRSLQYAHCSVVCNYPNTTEWMISAPSALFISNMEPDSVLRCPGMNSKSRQFSNLSEDYLIGRQWCVYSFPNYISWENTL